MASLASLASLAIAQDTSYVDGEGDVYTSRRDRSGIVLDSFFTTIRLTPACEASSPRYGTGTWGWANGGFVVTFADRTVGFARQQIDLDNDHGCRL